MNPSCEQTYWIDAQGWRPYTGGGIYDASGPTKGHYDHVHVSTTD